MFRILMKLLMKLLAIRLTNQKTIDKSLVIAIRFNEQNTFAKSPVMLQLKCKQKAASDRRAMRDEAYEIEQRGKTDGLVPPQTRARGGGSSGAEETD